MSKGADTNDHQPTEPEQIAWDDIDAETQHELVALAETLGSEQPEEDAKAQTSRREIIKAAGALGLGAAVGGGSYRAFSQPAAASHGGGSVGTSSNPVDLFASVIEADGPLEVVGGGAIYSGTTESNFMVSGTAGLDSIIAAQNESASNLFIGAVASSDSSMHATKYEGRRARGTLGSLDPVQAGDNTVRVSGHARNGNGGWTEVADIRAQASSAPSGSTVPGEVKFRTRDSSDTFTTRAKVDDTGITADSVSTDNLTSDVAQVDTGGDWPKAPAQAEHDGEYIVGPLTSVDNPIIEGADVNGDWAADPWPFYDRADGTAYIFYEEYDSANSEGAIGYQSGPTFPTVSGATTILDESGTHYAYPQVRQINGTKYLVPTGDWDGLRFYEFGPFPSTVSLATTKLSTTTLRDQTLLHYDPDRMTWGDDTERWWVIAFDGSGAVNAYHSTDPIGGSWTPHDNNPIHSAAKTRRPGGRPMERRNYVDFFYQDASVTGTNSGDRIVHYHITDLTPSSFSQTEGANSPIVQRENTGDWNDEKMHHFAPMRPTEGSEPIYLVDGGGPNSWSIGLYTSTGRLDHSAAALKTSTQAVNSGSEVRVTFDSATPDVSNAVDTSNDYYVTPSAGVYDIEGHVQFSAPGTAVDWTVTARLKDFGTQEVLDETVVQGNQAASMSARVRFKDYLAAGRNIRLTGIQDSGEQLNYTTECKLIARRVR